jgi:hypothetical protein
VIRNFLAIGLIGLGYAGDVLAFSYQCSENYRLEVRPAAKLVMVWRGQESCPEVAQATFASVRAKNLSRLQAVDRYDSRNRYGLLESKANSTYPEANCRNTYQLGPGETAVVWVSQGVFRGEDDATLEVEYADPKKPLETIRMKCQIESR